MNGRDILADRWKSIALYGVPICAIIVGANWAEGRVWLWIPAFLVMGIACGLNAFDCGRVHCYATAPLYVAAAGYEGLASAGVVPMPVNVFLASVVVMTVVAFALEVPLGRYRPRRGT